MDETLSIIDSYNQLLYTIYDREQLVCLSDNGYTINGKNVLSYSNPAIVRAAKIGLYDYLNEITDKLKKPRFNDMHAEGEIIVATADLKYRLGTMYLYHPYIVILEESCYYFQGEKQFCYEQTRNDARYNREIPIAFESLYKYWQRLSDYLLHFFPDGLLACNGRSFFHTPFDFIKKHHKNLCHSKNFQWLESFSENGYAKFNSRRKFFVHTAGYDNRFFQDYLEAHNEEIAMLAMDEERTQLLDILKENMGLCIEGYFKMMDFINEIEFSKDNVSGAFSYSLIKNNDES